MTPLTIIVLLTVDTVPPIVTCPRDVSQTTGCNTVGTNVEFDDATATDNSGTANLVSQSHRSRQFFVVGTTSVTYTFTDPSGNRADCSFDVFVTEGRAFQQSSTRITLLIIIHLYKKKCEPSEH